MFALAIAALITAAAVVAVILLTRQARHRGALRTLYLEADALERDLKQCRDHLALAHAVMPAGAGAVAGETAARQAVDAALRELLAHRLWLRDEADKANQRALDDAVHAIGKVRSALNRQLLELDSAQRALESAVRGHAAGTTRQ